MHLYETTESIHSYQEEKIPISIKTHIIILFLFLTFSEFTSPDGQKFYSKDSLTGFTPENHYPGSSSGSGYRYESPGGTGPRSRSGSGSVSPGKRYNGGSGSGSVGNEQNIRTENRMNSELDDRTGTGGMDPKKDNRGNGINDIGNYNAGFSLYPNPTNGIVRINSTNQTIQSIKIYSLTSELLHEYFTSEFSIADLPEGIYIVAGQTDNGFFYSKLIKQ